MLFLMQAAKKVPVDMPNVLNGVRAGYIISNLLIVGICLFIKYKIDSKKGRRSSSFLTRLIERHVLKTNPSSFVDMTTLKYVEPSPMGSTDPPKLVTTTVHAYDISALKSQFKSQVMAIGMLGFMHLYLKYTNPLIIQSILPLKSALESNLAKIHIWGVDDKQGDLKRPWKANAGGGIMGALAGGAGGANEIKTDKASIEAAERAGRGGVKEE
ncbi:MAG: hypothetical protein M1831_006820 [Alyxoria varia]|nr:MAG: hypothetical protein M1831_006820 [Alyxoria varia]